MSTFDIVLPKGLDEALALVAGDDPLVRPMGGGTALMLMMKSGMFQPNRLVCLQQIGEPHAGIRADEAGALIIGAQATLAALEHAPDALRLVPSIGKVMKGLANVRVRNVARIGGCLAHGDPHMDLPPLFAALGAQLRLVTAEAERIVPVDEFFLGYYVTDLAPGELIVEVTIPPQKNRQTLYRKITTRTHDDWPALGIALSLIARDGQLMEPRLVVSAATDRVMRLPETETLLADGDIAGACKKAAEEAPLVDDSRGSAEYKAHLLQVHLRRSITELQEQAA